MKHFYEVPRRIEGSEIEFSHKLALEPIAVQSSRSFGAQADGASRSAVHVASRRWHDALGLN
jgi:hypothetical protein